MLDEFKEYLQKQGKSANTIKTYLRDVELFLRWCTQSFDKESDRLYRANVQDYISYMRNIRRYSAGSVNNHLSSLRCYNEFLIEAGYQTEAVVLQKDFMKIQRAYASPCSVEQKDVKAFRQRLLESGNRIMLHISTKSFINGVIRQNL